MQIKCRCYISVDFGIVDSCAVAVFSFLLSPISAQWLLPWCESASGCGRCDRGS